MLDANRLFRDIMNSFLQSYSDNTFYVKRDLVWTVQTMLIHKIRNKGLDFQVFNDFGILPGNRRKLSTDIAILDKSGKVEVAIEFTYEPDHKRIDIPKNKFPVVFWGKEGVAKDIDRIQRFVNEAGALHAYAIFIDEGGHFRKREPHPGSLWLDWGDDTSVLWTEAHQG